jgi:hypothetical protein
MQNHEANIQLLVISMVLCRWSVAVVPWTLDLGAAQNTANRQVLLLSGFVLCGLWIVVLYFLLPICKCYNYLKASS